LSLTQAFNEPIAGDVKTTKEVDTLSFTVPKNTGVNQMWDFSSMMATGTVESTTYGSSTAGGPHSAQYPGTTLTDFDGGTFYDYLKSTTGVIESLGFEDANIVLTFTNTAVMANFPFTIGSSFSD